MFFKKKVGVRCDHDWHELETIKEVEFDNIVYFETKERDNSYIYCPKCDSRKKVRSNEWRRIEKSQEIKKAYNRKNVNGWCD